MITRPYVKGSPDVSRLGFGGWPLGNEAHGHRMDQSEGVALVRQAFDAGVNFFDTSPNYAFGRSESILGIALKDVRDKVVINTKFGHKADGTSDFDPGHIRASVTESLKRLETDYLDSVILHNPPMEILRGETGHQDVFKALKAEGLIKGYGVSIDSRTELETVLDSLEVDVIELLFNVYSQQSRELLEEVKARGIALVIKVPLDSGWLTGKYDRNTAFDGIRSRWTHDDIIRRDVLTKKLKAITGSDDLVPYAMGFLWSFDAVTTVIPGIRTPNQLLAHLKAERSVFERHLKDAFIRFHDTLIASDPLPW
jgi:aryl-alcohol dehydrogenase-like predicted oxidoreductase